MTQGRGMSFRMNTAREWRRGRSEEVRGRRERRGEDCEKVKQISNAYMFFSSPFRALMFSVLCFGPGWG